jgi:hypothetical protein
LSARHRLYTAIMDNGEQMLTDMNRVRHLADILKSINVTIDEKDCDGGT